MSNVTRWNPFREIAEMQRQLDRVFDEVWNGTESSYEANWMPVDVTETEGSYTVVADLPGLNPDDINVNFHDGVLTISGEIHQNTANEDDRILVRERTYGKFSRRINLPMSVDADNITAAYDNGVLTLELPKAESAKPRQIQVKQNKLLNNGS